MVIATTKLCCCVVVVTATTLIRGYVMLWCYVMVDTLF